MPTVSEVAPDLFRISIFVPDFDLQFNQFLVRDHRPSRRGDALSG